MVRNGGSLNIMVKNSKEKVDTNCIVLDVSVTTVAFFSKDKNVNV